MKHERIFQRFIIALGYTQDHGLEILTQVELGRADKVPHVLDEKKVELGDVQISQGFLDHIAVQMAGPSGVDLNDRRPGLADPFGVVGGLDIPLDYPDAEIIFQGLDRFFQERSLAGSGRTHEVNDQDPILRKLQSVFLCYALVGLQDVFNDRNFHLRQHSPFRGSIYCRFSGGFSFSDGGPFGGVTSIASGS